MTKNATRKGILQGKLARNMGNIGITIVFMTYTNTRYINTIFLNTIYVTTKHISKICIHKGKFKVIEIMYSIFF